MTSLKLLLAPLALVVAIVLYLAVLSFLHRHTVPRAANDRFLQPCPDKPNCVSSLATDEPHRIAPLPILDNDKDRSWSRLMSVLRQTGGALVADDGTYAHAVYTSTLFRFKDDVELVLQDNALQIRSASRAGTSDLGQNRQRVERIRELYLQQN